MSYKQSPGHPEPAPPTGSQGDPEPAPPAASQGDPKPARRSGSQGGPARRSGSQGDPASPTHVCLIGGTTLLDLMKVDPDDMPQVNCVLRKDLKDLRNAFHTRVDKPALQ